MTPRRKAPTAQVRRWASISQTADYYGSCEKTIKRRIAEGKIRAYRLPGGRSVRIDLNEVDASMVSVPSAVHA